MQSYFLHNKNAFTLIELMVVVTIIVIVSLATYLPYAHHQKKVLLKQWVKEIVQSITEARNLAINGINTWSGNLNVGVFFSPNAEEIIYYTQQFETPFDLASLPSSAYKTKKLPPGIQIDSITSATDTTLFWFSAISWDLNLLTSDTTYTLTDNIKIQVSYKWSTSPVLQKEIEYYTQSFISDY